MVPSAPAYTRFCDGVASSFAAARNWVKVLAVSIRSRASMVRFGRRRADLAEVLAGVGQQRSVPGAADVDGPRRVLPRHLDLLGPHLERLVGLAHPYGVA